LIVDLQLKSKIALVPGSTAGIGFAIGSGLPGEGATVINGRSKKHVDQAIKTIRQKHPEANLEACAGDLSTTDTVQRVLSWCPTRSDGVEKFVGQIAHSRGISPLSAATNGAPLRVDGGVIRSII
jgi:NAD(P)-dependent dehydrogenase (short-subunit alcohol dehydrogenase family)